MSARCLQYLFAGHTMLGRCQMSRRAGNLKRALIQWSAAQRLFGLALKS